MIHEFNSYYSKNWQNHLSKQRKGTKIRICILSQKKLRDRRGIFSGRCRRSHGAVPVKLAAAAMEKFLGINCSVLLCALGQSGDEGALCIEGRRYDLAFAQP